MGGVRLRVAGALISCALVGAFAACSASNNSGTPSGNGGGINGNGGGTSGGAVPNNGGFVGTGSMPSGNGGFVDIPGNTGGTPPPPPPPVTTDAPPFVADETSASKLPADMITKLKAGGGSCTAKIIYPYENTMFPVGLPLQTIMWDGASDASYVHLKYEGSNSVDYQFAAGQTQNGEITLPQVAWNEIASRTTGGPLNVTVTSISGGTTSTCTQHWLVAPGIMSGSIYYNTYDAPGATIGGNGAVMRLALGAAQSEIYEQFTGQANIIPGTGPCVSCHSLSFNGQVLAASTHDYMAKTFPVFSYNITPTPQPPQTKQLPNALFGALTPDGSRLLGMGNPQCTDGSESFPRKPNNFPLLEGPDVATLYDVAQAKAIDAKGLNKDWYMWMPQFSPNFNKVVFNHAKPDGKGGTDRRELAVMDFDKATNTFSNLKVIASKLGPDPSIAYNPGPAGAGAIPTGPNGCTSTPAPPIFGDVGAIDPGTCTGPCYPAWPFFTPDGKGVVFQLSSEPDFASAFPGRPTPSKSELWYANLVTGKNVKLTNAITPLNSGDALMDYYPTVMPFAVGGKFWFFWTSRRAVGHRNYGASTVPGLDSPDKKRIWVAALDIEPADGADPSHPGFYLPGQSNSGNLRAFAALNPCKKTGDTCQSGLDCCSGFCAFPAGQTTGTCVDSPPNNCSRENDKCTSDSDCCPPGAGERPLKCLGGFCGYVKKLE